MARILVIDEETLIHGVVAAALEDEGHHVTGYSSVEALLTTEDRSWDLILLQVGIPATSLDQQLEQVRKNCTADLVLLSSSSVNDTEPYLKRLSAVDVIYKPIDPRQLRSMVARALETSVDPPEAPGQPRCLVVDDDDLVCGSVIDILDDQGYRVFGAESARAALDVLNEQPIDILITDVMMEGMSGLDLIEKLPTTSPGTMSLVMTGFATKDVAIKALQLGAFDLLEKPLEPKRVAHAVQRAWQMRRSELENRRLLFELRELNHELIGARDRAEAADRAKSEFLTNMSHEVRTPLSGVLGCLDILGRRPSTDPSDQRIVDAAQESGAALLELLTRILDYVSLESPEAQPLVEIDLAQTIHEVIEKARADIESAGLQVNFHANGRGLARLAGSRESVSQMAAILLENARQFTPEGRIDLRLELEDSRALLEVQDTGIGIAAEHQCRIFEPFFQVDGSTTRQVGGVGMGLALCKRLARSFGGRVELESSLGSGSQFTLHLPLQGPADNN